MILAFIAFVGQIGNLRRIGNPPAGVVRAAGRRISNPPQVANLPHKTIRGGK